MAILIVNKDDNQIKELSDILIKNGLKTVTTNSSKHAKRIIDQNHHIDLVITCYQSFNDPGTNLVSYIRQSQRFQWIPILLSCENCSAEIVEILRSFKVTGILACPLDKETVMEKVKHAQSNGKRNILLVDDEPEIIEVLQRMLEIERFNVFTAKSGEDGLQIIKKHIIHAVVSDIVMPQMSGVDLLKNIKKDNPEIPVILITGYSGKYKPEDIMASGADGYFRKPFKNTELVNNLRGIIQTHRRNNLLNASAKPA